MHSTTVTTVGPIGPLPIDMSGEAEGPLQFGSFLNDGTAPLFDPASATILMVDDEPIDMQMLRVYLEEAGYERFEFATNASQAIERAVESPPDVVLIDTMPDGSGFDVLRALRADRKLHRVPIVMLTSIGNPSAKRTALKWGVSDFLTKPVDPIELVLRLRNSIDAKVLQDSMAQHSHELEERVLQRTAELDAARCEALQCLARAAEYRDDDTGQHVVRVGRYVAMIARKLGMHPRQVELLELAAQLHDVGKIGIPDSILLKPGRLEPEEFDIMKKHCEFGRAIIRPMTDSRWQICRRIPTENSPAFTSSSPVMKLAASIAETHHERWDGSGYPRGLKGEEIPVEGRITAIADVFDALSNARPYKPAYERTKCFKILEEGRGNHFDPELLDLFFSCTDEIDALQHEACLELV
ncbi:MAG: response regulator [Pirellulaceae bacterium]|nr:response regulator [Planctomycetales bacterium]